MPEATLSIVERKPHSPRFIRLSEADIIVLFGAPALEPRFTISGGRFVARQRLDIVGQKARIDGVPVVGPPVEKTTISFSVGDSERLGLDALSDRGVLLVGPSGEVKLNSALP